MKIMIDILKEIPNYLLPIGLWALGTSLLIGAIKWEEEEEKWCWERMFSEVKRLLKIIKRGK